MLNYICKGTGKNEMIREIMDNVIPYISKGAVVSVPNFGIGFYDLLIIFDPVDRVDVIHICTTTPENGNGCSQYVYTSDYVHATSREDIKAELETAWSETENEIWYIERTGGNCETIVGLINGKYFACDQCGDGVYLKVPYDSDWSYKEFKGNKIAPISDEDRDVIYHLWMNWV